MNNTAPESLLDGKLTFRQGTCVNDVGEPLITALVQYYTLSEIYSWHRESSDTAMLSPTEAHRKPLQMDAYGNVTGHMAELIGLRFHPSAESLGLDPEIIYFYPSLDKLVTMSPICAKDETQAWRSIMMNRNSLDAYITTLSYAEYLTIKEAFEQRVKRREAQLAQDYENRRQQEEERAKQREKEIVFKS